VVPSLQWPRPSSKQLPVNRVELGAFTPDLEVYLGQAAYLQLALSEALGRATESAPSVRAQAVTARVAGATLDRHRGLTAEIQRSGGDPAASMEPHVAAIDEFRRRTTGSTWFETMLAHYVCAGLLDDVFVRLAAGLSADHRDRIVTVLEAGDDAETVAEILSASIEADPRLASRLALWGRRHPAGRPGRHLGVARVRRRRATRARLHRADRGAYATHGCTRPDGLTPDGLAASGLRP
jgi:hypothetical protein